MFVRFTSMALLFVAPSGRAQTPVMMPCTVNGLSGDVRCGTVSVPENRGRPGGRRLNIAVVVARATGASREPDPFVLLAGGPGQAGTQMGPFATEAFGRVRERRDLVLIDARGTGRSNGLRCAFFRQAADLVGWTMYPTASALFCRDSLSRTNDLAQYTTANIADDLEDVRRAFAWPAINIYGTSYGTRLALTYMRRHASSVRSMVLKAVAPPNVIGPMNYAEDTEVALDHLERDCRADSTCAAMTPSVRNDLRVLAARADSGLLRVTVPWQGANASATLSRDAVVSTLMGALQSAGQRAGLPAILRRAVTGDIQSLGTLVAQYRLALDQQIYMGMHLSVMCGEDGRRNDLNAARATDSRTLLGSARVRMLIDACREWTVPAETPNAHEAVRSSLPVLLVSGELDPNTPARLGDIALQTLPNSRHIVLKGVAHGWSNVGNCGAALVADYVARRSVQGLDVSCAAVSSAPAFATPPR
jgi:pimeloyl-ACP methyl ester carboxylesterase